MVSTRGTCDVEKVIGNDDLKKKYKQYAESKKITKNISESYSTSQDSIRQTIMLNPYINNEFVKARLELLRNKTGRYILQTWKNLKEARRLNNIYTNAKKDNEKLNDLYEELSKNQAMIDFLLKINGVNDYKQFLDWFEDYHSKYTELKKILQKYGDCYSTGRYDEDKQENMFFDLKYNQPGMCKFIDKLHYTQSNGLRDFLYVYHNGYRSKCFSDDNVSYDHMTITTPEYGTPLSHRTKSASDDSEGYEHISHNYIRNSTPEYSG